MSNDPQFFDSVDDFIAHQIDEWEMENPRPRIKVAPQPEKPEPQIIPLQGQGFVVVECGTSGQHYSLTVSKKKTVQTTIDHETIEALIDALMYIHAESRDYFEWATKQLQKQGMYNERLTYWRKKRDKVAREAGQAYQNHKIAGNGKFERNKPIEEYVFCICERKSYDGKICYAVCVYMPHYRTDGAIEVGGTEKWTFWNAEEAYQDAERRAEIAQQEGKKARAVTHVMEVRHGD